MTQSDVTNPLDDRFFDRIVDGELTPAELRAAIARLDRDLDGWKRCALAFVEAQCWRQSFQAMGQSAPLSVNNRSVSVRPGLPLRTGIRRRWLHGSIAAGLVAASFAMGWVGHGARSSPGAGPIVNVRAGSNSSPIGGDSQSESVVPTSGDHHRPVRLAVWQTTRERQSPPRVTEVIRSVGRVHFGTEGTGADVPILAGPGITEQWLRNQPPPLNEHGQVALQRQGYQVGQSRQLITKTLADGRRVTVPIDQVQIRFTGNDPL